MTDSESVELAPFNIGQYRSLLGAAPAATPSPAAAATAAHPASSTVTTESSPKPAAAVLVGFKAEAELVRASGLQLRCKDDKNRHINIFTGTGMKASQLRIRNVAKMWQPSRAAAFLNFRTSRLLS